MYHVFTDQICILTDKFATLLVTNIVAMHDTFTTVVSMTKRKTPKDNVVVWDRLHSAHTIK